MNNDISVSARLKDSREYLGLSVGFVVKQTGIAEKTLLSIEAGLRKIEKEELSLLSRLYKYPEDYFFSEKIFSDDETAQIVPRTRKDLNDIDRMQVLRFAEWLKYSGKQASGNRGIE